MHGLTFYRGEHGRPAGDGGAGVGLHVCKELARRLGGRVGLEPRGKQGAAFFVELPLADR